jgi:hypothetical protein
MNVRLLSPTKLLVLIGSRFADRRAIFDKVTWREPVVRRDDVVLSTVRRAQCPPVPEEARFHSRDQLIT